MANSKEITAVVWNQGSAKSGIFDYKIQIDGLNGLTVKTAKKIFDDWNEAGSGYNGSDIMMLYRKKFPSQEVFYKWAESLPYPLQEITSHGNYRSIKTQYVAPEVTRKSRSDKGKKGKRTCGKCGKTGHNARTCGQPSSKKSKVSKGEGGYKCGKCGETGHNARTCGK